MGVIADFFGRTAKLSFVDLAKGLEVLMRNELRLLWWGTVLSLAACGGRREGAEARDAAPEAAIDSGASEAGASEAGTDAAIDSGASEAGASEAGTDAAIDSGASEAGTDAGGSATACRKPSECVLDPAGCCEPCGRPTLDAYDAVHVRDRNAHRREVCPDPSAEPCPRCAVTPNPNLGATCEATSGLCVAFDVERDAVSACRTDTDCVVRRAGCCECTGGELLPSQLVALAREKVADYRAMVCDPDTACAACVPTYPPGVRAACQRGHCKVVVEGR